MGKMSAYAIVMLADTSSKELANHKAVGCFKAQPQMMNRLVVSIYLSNRGPSTIFGDIWLPKKDQKKKKVSKTLAFGVERLVQ